MKFLIVILGVVSFGLLGCYQIKQRSIANDIVDTVDRVALVCNTVEMFSAVGLDAPGSEQCGKLMKVIDTNEYETIYDVAGCAKSYEVDSHQFVSCVSRVDGWKDVAEKLL